MRKEWETVTDSIGWGIKMWLAWGGCYKECRIQDKIKSSLLSDVEFVRRLLMHGFIRIRHYGFLANSQRRRRLKEIRECIEREAHAEKDIPPERMEGAGYPATDAESAIGVTEKRCPRCRQGHLHVIGMIEGHRRRP